MNRAFNIARILSQHSQSLWATSTAQVGIERLAPGPPASFNRWPSGPSARQLAGDSFRLTLKALKTARAARD